MGLRGPAALEPLAFRNQSTGNRLPAKLLVWFEVGQVFDLIGQISHGN